MKVLNQPILVISISIPPGSLVISAACVHDGTGIQTCRVRAGCDICMDRGMKWAHEFGIGESFDEGNGTVQLQVINVSREDKFLAFSPQQIYSSLLTEKSCKTKLSRIYLVEIWVVFVQYQSRKVNCESNQAC